MLIRQRLFHFVVGCVSLIGSIIFVDEVRPQAPPTLKLAFQSNRDGNNEIYVMKVVLRQAQDPRNLTNHPDEDSAPVWSPDGRQIAFISERDDDQEIYAMDADGMNQRNLTNHPSDDFSPTWSPDGQKIAFTTKRDGFFEEIYTVDANGENPVNLTNEPKRDYMPTWSPDGEKIAFVSFRELLGASEVYVMNPDGKQPRRLTNSAVGDIFPDWSPDSQRLIWLITNPGNIAVMNADGENPVNVSDDNKSERGFWSPDGEKIALLTQRDGNPGDLRNGRRWRESAQSIKSYGGGHIPSVGAG